MSLRLVLLVCAISAAIFCVACSNAPGRPSRNVPQTPDQILDFATLFQANCAGCHGANGKGGAAIALGDPVFLAIANNDVIRNVMVNGMRGTLMPAFAQSAGGVLTDQQVDAIVHGIRAWEKPDALQGVSAPPYAVQAAGDPRNGETVYATYCASCHGADGKGGKASSIVNGSYLALVSDQFLRSVVITGRPELGAPDWRNNLPGQPMKEQEISDVVAWLSSQRPAFPGRPYPTLSAASSAGGTQ